MSDIHSSEPTVDAQYRLPDHVVELMQPLGRKQSFKRGEALFQVGSEPDGLYALITIQPPLPNI